MKKQFAAMLLSLFLPFVAVPQSGVGPTAELIPKVFFGMAWVNNASSHTPSVPFGAMRLWGSSSSWMGLNPSPGVYNFGPLDTWLSRANARGVDVLYTFGYVPQFISSNPTQACGEGNIGCAAPPSDVSTGDTTFKNFVTALVNHSLKSTPHIKYYELWNEPNYSGFWTGTTAQLAIMTNDAYAIIHSLDPSALTVGPSPTGSNPDRWIQGYYAAGGKQDITGTHTIASLATTLRDITNIKAVQAANGKSNLPLWVTEGNEGASQGASFSNDQKVAYMAQEYLGFLNLGVARFYWYAWDDRRYGQMWTLVGGVQPKGTAYGLLNGWLVGAVYNPATPCSKDSNETWTCPIIRDGTLQQITYNVNGAPLFTYTVPSGFGHYQTLDNTIIHVVSGGTVALAAGKPYLLTP